MRKKNKIGNGRGQSLAADKATDRVPSIPNVIANGEGQQSVSDKDSRLVPPAREPVAEGMGQRASADRATLALPAPPRFSDDPRIQDIMALASERGYWMQMRLRNTARLAAEIRRHLQPTRGQEDEWSEDVKSEALEIVHEAVRNQLLEMRNIDLVSAGKKPRGWLPKKSHKLLSANFVRITARSLAEYELTEDAVLARMTDVAATFPIAAFVNSPERKGFTLAGLAIIIGHVGHPLDYPKKGHLWKRLGLAPFSKDGVTRAASSWGKFGGLAKEDWIELGYKKQRLGDIFGKITTPLRYAQWRSTGAIGPYGKAYGDYKARQTELNNALWFAEEADRQASSAKKNGIKPRKELLDGKLTPMAIERRAMRYMTKKLIADLWFAWRRLDQKVCGDKPNAEMSITAESFAGRASDDLLRCEARLAVPNPQTPFPDEGHAHDADKQGQIQLANVRKPNRRKANGTLPSKAIAALPISELTSVP